MPEINSDLVFAPHEPWKAEPPLEVGLATPAEVQAFLTYPQMASSLQVVFRHVIEITTLWTGADAG
jgi:hypothetical protein